MGLFADPAAWIVSTLAAALGNLSQVAVRDAYDAIKSFIARKYGATHLPASMEVLESRADSPGRREVVREELAETGADRDEELAVLVELLSRHVRPAGEITTITQTVSGDRNVLSGTGNVIIKQSGKE